MVDLNALKKIAVSQQREISKIEGRLESLMEQLKENGYSSVEDARKDLEKMNTQIKSMRKKFDGKLKEFETKHADQISKASR